MLLPLVGNDGMPTERPPPLVAVLPAATPTAEGMIKIIKEETMQLNIDAPIICFSVGPSLATMLQ